MSLKFNVKAIVCGNVEGEALVSLSPLSFYGGVDRKTGIVVERGHPLEGQKIAGKILFFPYGKGSTVGSYVIYGLAMNGLAPAAIVNVKSEPIIVIGCVLANIPLFEGVTPQMLNEVKTGSKVRITCTGKKAFVEVYK